MRHQTDHVAACVGDPGDVAVRTVRVYVEVAGDDATLGLEFVERPLIGDKPTLAVLDRDDDLDPASFRCPRRRSVLDAQPLVPADELAVVVADQCTRQQMRLAQHLNPLQMPSSGSPSWAASTIVAMTGANRARRRSAGSRRRRNRPAALPRPRHAATGRRASQRDGVGTGEPQGAGGVAVVEAAGKGDHPDAHRHASSLTRHGSYTALPRP
jgi:hypothetical protein